MVRLNDEKFTLLNLKILFQKSVRKGLNSTLLDAERTINHSSHVLSGARLQVSLFVEEDESADEFGENEGEDQDLDEEDSITIIVSDIPSSTSEDAVTFYFENSRRSGGGDVSEIHYKDSGEAVITFSEVKGT